MDEPTSKPVPFVCLSPVDQALGEIAQAFGLSPDGARAVAAIDDTMMRMRRGMVRRDFGRSVLRSLDAELDLVHMDAMGVIAPAPGEEGERAEVTVGLVAERLEIDPSRASRVVAELVERGYARRIASQADARRIGLELSDRGHWLLSEARRIKWQAFVASLASWRDDELLSFAELLERFSTWTQAALREETAALQQRAD